MFTALPWDYPRLRSHYSSGVIVSNLLSETSFPFSDVAKQYAFTCSAVQFSGNENVAMPPFSLVPTFNITACRSSVSINTSHNKSSNAANPLIASCAAADTENCVPKASTVTVMLGGINTPDANFSLSKSTVATCSAVTSTAPRFIFTKALDVVLPPTPTNPFRITGTNRLPKPPSSRIFALMSNTSGVGLSRRNLILPLATLSPLN